MILPSRNIDWLVSAKIMMICQTHGSIVGQKNAMAILHAARLTKNAAVYQVRRRERLSFLSTAFPFQWLNVLN
jgi:hypothetical protein